MNIYPCPKSTEMHGRCQYGGNKVYNHGVASGTASYCRLVQKWVRTIETCPKLKANKCSGDIDSE